MSFRPDAIVIHYTDSDDVSAETVNYWHRHYLPRGNNPLKHIGYHALIRKSGTIERGRSLDVPGTHCKGHNFHTLGVCLCGSDELEWYPTKEQYRSLVAWCENRMDEFGIPLDRIYFHRDLYSTTCPGRLDKKRILSMLSDSLKKREEEEMGMLLRTSDNVATEHHFLDVWTSKYDLQYLHIQLRAGQPAKIDIYATKDMTQKPPYYQVIHTLVLSPTKDNPNPYVKIPISVIADSAGFKDCAISVHSTQPIACAMREGNYE